MKVSVALCTFNGERFLADQLESILSQSYQVDEIIICDDCSEDATVQIARTFQQQHPNVIKIIFNEINLKPIRNFEKAIQQCSGDIIFLSDQDDIWLPDKVKVMCDFFREHCDALLLFTNAHLIDENNNLIDGNLWDAWGFDDAMRESWKDNSQAFRYLLRGDNKVTGATLAFRKELKKSALPFEHIHKYMHDAWLALFASRNNGLFFIESPLINYRVHPNQLVGIGNGLLMRKGFLPQQTMAFRKVIKSFKKLIKRVSSPLCL